MLKWLNPFKDYLIGQLVKGGGSRSIRWKIVIAALLSSLALYYVVALALQLVNIPKVLTGEITLNPLKLISTSTAPPVYLLILAITVFLVTPVFYRFIMDAVKIRRGTWMDERFAISDSKAHGSAQWLQESELESNGKLEYKSYAKTRGIILGKAGEKPVSQNPDGPLNKHIMVVGTSGSRKTTNFIIPYIYQAIDMGESVISVDIKGEVYEKTVDYAYRNGYDVKVINAANPANSNGFNILKAVGCDVTEAHKLANQILECAKKKASDNDIPFWRDGCMNLLKALILMVNEEAEIEARRRDKNPENWNPRNGFGTIGRLYDYLTDYEKDSFLDLQDRFERVRKMNPGGEHPFLKPWKAFSANSEDKVVKGVIQNLAGKLNIFDNPAICEVMGADDIDLIAPGKRKCIYYVIIDEMDRSYDMVSSLFFTTIVQKLLKFSATRANSALDVPVTFLVDEFGVIGTIPNWDSVVTGGRSRGIRAVMAFQDVAQLNKLYPESATTIMGNCGIWLGLKINDPLTAQVFVERIGRATIVDQSYRVQHRTCAMTNMSEEYAESITNMGRDLLDPSELARMPIEELVMAVDGMQPMILRKNFYAEMPQFKSGIDFYKLQNFRSVDRNLKMKYQQGPVYGSGGRTARPGIHRGGLLDLKGYLSEDGPKSEVFATEELFADEEYFANESASDFSGLSYPTVKPVAEKSVSLRGHSRKTEGAARPGETIPERFDKDDKKDSEFSKLSDEDVIRNVLGQPGNENSDNSENRDSRTRSRRRQDRRAQRISPSVDSQVLFDFGD